MSDLSADEINKIISEAISSTKGRSKLAQATVRPIRERLGLTHYCSTCGSPMDMQVNECCIMEKVLKE